MSEEHIIATPPRHSFTRKTISVTFNVVNQDGSTGSLTLEPGHRIRATIDNSGMATGVRLFLTIEGMTAQEMQRLSHIGNITNAEQPVLRDQSQTTVTVKAGTYGSKALPVVFFGMLTESFASFNGGSSVFTVHAFTTGDLLIEPPRSRSYRGSKTVLELLEDICRDRGIRLVNHGGWQRYSVLNNHYAEGTTLDHIQAIITACKASFHYIPLVRTQAEKPQKVTHTGELHIWGPTYCETEDDDTHLALVSATTGMIGYPEYNLYGIKFSCLFRTDINFLVPFKIKSDQMPAGWEVDPRTHKNADGQIIQDPSLPYEGLWLPFWISHDISAEVPNGPWSTSVECQRSDASQNYSRR